MMPVHDHIRPAWILSDAPDVLERIHDDAVQLALWERPRPASLDWLDGLDLDDIDDVHDELYVAGLESYLPQRLFAAGYPQDDRTTALAGHIATTACRFARIMATDALRIRLEIIETDACRKFHMDQVQARLLMPLTEPGTQWIESHAGSDAPIRQLRAGHVGVFKGRVWAESPAILHRSPPITGSGKTRLLLVLDLPLALPAAR
jgi:hypothetical protein